MWIRSQDKLNLVNTYLHDIYIDYMTDDNHQVKYTTIRCADFILGRYKTLEQATKILDTIQRLLEEPTYTNDQGNEYAHYPKNVFQMPQDKEIEV